MIYLIIAYILGIITTLILIYRNLDKGYKITLIDTCVALVFAAFSWIGVLGVSLFFYGDRVLFTKK